jgi:hypothetical protein
MIAKPEVESILSAVSATRVYVERIFAERVPIREEFVTSSDDPRAVCFRKTFADGRVEELQFRVPALVYRDVYRADFEYEKHDVVTRSGSAWICTAEKTTATPGASGDWRLMMKSAMAKTRLHWRNCADEDNGGAAPKADERRHGRGDPRGASDHSHPLPLRVDNMSPTDISSGDIWNNPR